MEDSFSDLGIDAITGTEIMRLTGITPVDFTDPARYQRFKEVCAHLKNIEDKQFYISRITTGKNVDKLDHLWGYVELERRLHQKVEEAKRVQEEISILTRFSSEKDIHSIDDIAGYTLATKKKEAITNNISQIQQEMSHYER